MPGSLSLRTKSLPVAGPIRDPHTGRHALGPTPSGQRPQPATAGAAIPAAACRGRRLFRNAPPLSGAARRRCTGRAERLLRPGLRAPGPRAAHAPSPVPRPAPLNAPRPARAQVSAPPASRPRPAPPPPRPGPAGGGDRADSSRVKPHDPIKHSSAPGPRRERPASPRRRRPRPPRPRPRQPSRPGEQSAPSLVPRPGRGRAGAAAPGCGPGRGETGAGPEATFGPRRAPPDP